MALPDEEQHIDERDWKAWYGRWPQLDAERRRLQYPDDARLDDISEAELFRAQMYGEFDCEIPPGVLNPDPVDVARFADDGGPAD